MNSYYEKQEQDIRNDWFKTHAAVPSIILREHGLAIHKLTWQRPGTTNYLVEYLLLGGTLLVHGDLGYAVYRWTQKHNFGWVASCDLGYFASKCMASEEGRSYMTWDERAASMALNNEVKGMARDYAVPVDRVWNALNEAGAKDCLHSSEDWHYWCLESHKPINELMGDPGWYERLGDIGKVISIRCHAHLIGIKMAIAQIAAGINVRVCRSIDIPPIDTTISDITLLAAETEGKKF